MIKENIKHRQNIKTITVHYFNLQLEKALFKVKEETGFKINRYDRVVPYTGTITYFEIIHIGTNTVISNQQTYPDRGQLGSDILEWGINKGLIKEG
jgi:hypothetical protein